MVEHQQEVADIVLKQPYVDVVHVLDRRERHERGPEHRAASSCGSSRASERPDRGRDHPGAAAEARRGSRAFNVYPQNLPTIRIGGKLTKAAYQYTLQDADTAELYQWAPDPPRQDARPARASSTSTPICRSRARRCCVEIDRDQASALGVTAEQIENALYNAYGSPQVSTIYTPTNQYWVIMELLPQYQRDPAALSLLYIRSTSGKLVPLNAVAKLTRSVGPLTVNHLGQLPAVTISFNLQPGRVAGRRGGGDPQARARAAACPPPSPPASRARRRPSSPRCKGLGLLLLAAVLVIYLVLGILYESFIHPLTILSGLPSAGVGALLTLMIFDQELNLYGFVGHHHAGRHREEERHHDDRLRPRRAARRASRRARRSTRAAWCASARS